MTAAEFFGSTSLPASVGWLSCHFSSAGWGLSNVPKSLPPHSLLILDDSHPFQNHSAALILSQLSETVERLRPDALLLDFQRPFQVDIAELVQVLSAGLSCSVAAPIQYAAQDRPVFLPPAPLLQPLSDYLRPYGGREIWLELANPAMEISVTEGGCTSRMIPTVSTPLPHHDTALHIDYAIHCAKEEILFTLARQKDTLANYLTEAEAMGVAGAVGLFQEFQKNETALQT